MSSPQKEVLLAQLDCLETELHENETILEGIIIEFEVKGYLVLKLIKCGKSYCRCTKGGDLHGPYPHLQWWENGKIKTKYLNKKIYPKYKEQLDNTKKKLQITRQNRKLMAKIRQLKKNIDKFVD